MFNSVIRGNIIGNHDKKPDTFMRAKNEFGRGSWSLQYQDRPDDALTRVWQKLTPERVVDLLIDASFRPRYTGGGKSMSYLAGALLRDMRDSSWVIECAPHAGGKNNSTSKDPNLHITLRVSIKRARHLTCKEDPCLHLIDISDDDVHSK